MAEGSRPQIDEYPTEVTYRSPATITGHVGNESSHVVVLERRFPHNDRWKQQDKATTNDSGRVSFRLGGPRYTGDYRLKSGGVPSESVRVSVEPVLKIRLKKADVMRGKQAIVKGVFRPIWSDRQADLKWKDNGEWELIDQMKLADGEFKVTLPAKDVGRRHIRAVFDRDVRNTYARAGEVLRIHGRDRATWYGPGFFGRRTACGQTYYRDLLGVAHRTLPCGTKVSVLYKGRSVKVPVVDRGPYGHANWDLTEETAQRLRFRGRETVGVLH